MDIVKVLITVVELIIDILKQALQYLISSETLIHVIDNIYLSTNETNHF